MDTKCHGVIVAAGRSVRFGADKLSCRLEDGETVLFHAAHSLIAGGVSSLVIVGEPHDDHGLSRLGDRLHAIIPGGESAWIPYAVGWLHYRPQATLSRSMMEHVLSVIRS